MLKIVVMNAMTSVVRNKPALIFASFVITYKLLLEKQGKKRRNFISV